MYCILFLATREIFYWRIWSCWNNQWSSSTWIQFGFPWRQTMEKTWSWHNRL